MLSKGRSLHLTPLDPHGGLILIGAVVSTLDFCHKSEQLISALLRRWP